MGGIIFYPEELADSLSETAGYKAGLALSIDEICEHLSDSEYPEIIRASETQLVRLRAEDYEQLFYALLHRIGYTKEEFDGDITGIGLYHKYRNTALAEQHEGVTELFIEMMPRLSDEARERGSKLIDPRPFLEACKDRYGEMGLQMALERLEVMNRGLNLSPHSITRYVEWKDSLQLSALFAGTTASPELGKYIDQRFLDYLSANPEKLSAMHWRKFEELTAEFFDREGFRVELGPGSNDDGVDIRVWKPGQHATDYPLGLIQCKRQKDKVEKVIVKGLATDVTFEKAEYGVVVTTSELSPGARRTISARGYPIREVDRTGLNEWLVKLRTPGSGIVRV